MTLLKYIFAILLTIPIALIGWYFYEGYKAIADKGTKKHKMRRSVEEREEHNE